MPEPVLFPGVLFLSQVKNTGEAEADEDVEEIVMEV